MCCQSPLWDSCAFFLYSNSMCLISDWVGVVERPLHCPQSGSSASCAIYTVRNAHKQQMYQVSHLVWPLVPFLYVSCWWIWNEVGFGVIVLLSQRHWFLFKAGKTVIFLYCFSREKDMWGKVLFIHWKVPWFSISSLFPFSGTSANEEEKMGRMTNFLMCEILL